MQNFRWVGELRDDVHVYRINLNQPPDVIDGFLSYLSPEELERANRYRIDRARLQFTLTRGFLRQLLGDKLGIAPDKVPITYTASGKPTLANPDLQLYFNVTHTDGLALIALSDRLVGIDVERQRFLSNPEGLVDRFFSHVEAQIFQALSPELRLWGLFRGWTCKEAILKAAGLSLAHLDTFDVELHPARPATLLASRHPALLEGRWCLTTWEPAAGYVAALATKLDSLK